MKTYAVCRMISVFLIGMMVIIEIPLVAHLENFYKPRYSSVVWHHIDSSPRKQISRVITTLPDDLKVQEELQLKLKVAVENKIILIWSPAFGQKNPVNIDQEKCGKCQVTFDKAMVDDENTKAVVFHGLDMTSSPTNRKQDQLHIFWDMESSGNLMYQKLYPKNEVSYEFNATMTYRLDSDFLASYQSPDIGNSLMGKNDAVYKDIMHLKSKLAIAVVSDCSILPGARVRLSKIKELKNLGLRIDTFGWCFSTRLDRSETRNTIKNYKFYFAYENSYHCKDYITEKYFGNALESEAVPVVWGAVKEDYEAISPPNSFIFAEDFATPQKLIEYLNFLDVNDEEYLKYFRWRTMEPNLLPQRGRARGFCAVCRALHGINVDERYKPNYEDSKTPLFSNGISPKTIPSFLYWFYAEDNPECFQDMW